jgi:hypothetical protein
MTYRFPNNDEGAPSDFTVVPQDTIIPQGLHGMNLGGGGKVVVMNDAAQAEQIANPMGFISKVNPTGVIADIPLSIEEE